MNLQKIQFKAINFLSDSDSPIGDASVSQYKDIWKLLVDNSNQAKKRSYTVIAHDVEAQNFWVNWIFSNNLASKEWL